MDYWGKTRIDLFWIILLPSTTLSKARGDAKRRKLCVNWGITRAEFAGIIDCFIWQGWKASRNVNEKLSNLRKDSQTKAIKVKTFCDISIVAASFYGEIKLRNFPGISSSATRLKRFLVTAGRLPPPAYSPSFFSKLQKMRKRICAYDKLILKHKSPSVTVTKRLASDFILVCSSRERLETWRMPKMSSLFQYEHMNLPLTLKMSQQGSLKAEFFHEYQVTNRNVLFDKYLINKPHICGVIFLPHERFVGFETKYTHWNRWSLNISIWIESSWLKWVTGYTKM